MGEFSPILVFIMSKIQTIAVDSMSGDFGPEITIPAAYKAVSELKNLHLILVGNPNSIQHQLDQIGIKSHPHLEIKESSQVVEMDESPALALKKKKDSSMRVAINLVKEKSADACVSAGNTGALMATGKFVLKTIKGIDRPAICSALPSKNGHTHMLDLGANVDSSAEQLLQFAVMGSVLASCVNSIPNPTIGLLNIGSEAMKGNETIKAASQYIMDSGLNYHGFVEGNDIYKGTTDVVVSDGFNGNISLKTGEGLASFVSHVMKENFNRNILTKIIGLLAYPVLSKIKNKLDPRRYNGASFLGLNGIVVKSHGGADILAFFNAIKIAHAESIESVPQQISEQISQRLTRD